MSREQKGTAIWIAGFEMSEEPEILLPDFPQIRMRQLAGLNVALIEDDAVTLEATRDLLCRWGCNVTTYAHPPSDIAHQDIIVSDFEFADGSSLADHHGRWDKPTPIVVVSGHPRASVEQAVGKQAIAVLEKPLRASELRSALMAAKLSL